MTIFTEEINTIKDYLLTVSQTKCIKDQIYYSRELFRYIQTKPNFMAVNSSFRRAVINKLNEFENNSNIKNNNKMLQEIKNTYNFLDDIKYLENYKLEANEIPKTKIKIII
jgi:hypothetical protein